MRQLLCWKLIRPPRKWFFPFFQPLSLFLVVNCNYIHRSIFYLFRRQKSRIWISNVHRRILKNNSTNSRSFQTAILIVQRIKHGVTSSLEKLRDQQTADKLLSCVFAGSKSVLLPTPYARHSYSRRFEDTCSNKFRAIRRLSGREQTPICEINDKPVTRANQPYRIDTPLTNNDAWLKKGWKIQPRGEGGEPLTRWNRKDINFRRPLMPSRRTDFRFAISRGSEIIREIWSNSLAICPISCTISSRRLSSSPSRFSSPGVCGPGTWKLISRDKLKSRSVDVNCFRRAYKIYNVSFVEYRKKSINHFDSKIREIRCNRVY